MFEKLVLLEAKTLALVAWADGAVSDEERRMFRDMLESSPISDTLKIEASQVILQPPDEREVVSLLAAAPREVVASVLKTAYLMANADGEYSDKERSMIDRLVTGCGVPSSRLPLARQLLEKYLECERLEQTVFSSDSE